MIYLRNGHGWSQDQETLGKSGYRCNHHMLRVTPEQKRRIISRQRLAQRHEASSWLLHCIPNVNGTVCFDVGGACQVGVPEDNMYEYQVKFKKSINSMSYLILQHVHLHLRPTRQHLSGVAHEPSDWEQREPSRLVVCGW